MTNTGPILAQCWSIVTCIGWIGNVYRADIRYIQWTFILNKTKKYKKNNKVQQCLKQLQVMLEDTLSCPEGHLFCKECIRRSAEEVVGQGRVNFSCLTDCQSEFSTNTLQQVLTSKMFSLVLRKIQEEEIKKADIPDLVSCPFCPFATIMPDVEDKVFRCLNPECLKESCRWDHNCLSV